MKRMICYYVFNVGKEHSRQGDPKFASTPRRERTTKETGVPMDAKHLYCFKCVAELEHITKAAEQLYVSQSQLSRIIAEIEEEIGAPLFDRNGRGIKLNENGRIFYRYALKIIGNYSDAKARIREANMSSQFRLTIATNAGAYLPGMLAKLSESDKTLKIRQYSAPRKSIIAMLKNGSIDFAITAPPIDELGIDHLELATETPVVIHPESHWLRGMERVSLIDLHDEAFVGAARGFGARDSVEKYYDKLGITPNFVVETGDTASIERYVSCGIGIALCAKSLILNSPEFRNSFVEIEEEMPCEIGISWLKERTLNPHQHSFIRMAMDYFEDLESNSEQRAVEPSTCSV